MLFSFLCLCSNNAPDQHVAVSVARVTAPGDIYLPGCDGAWQCGPGVYGVEKGGL